MDWYNYYKSHGICVQCHTKDISVASVCRCDDCMEKNAEAQEKLRSANREKCQTKRKSSSKRLYDSRKANGLCVECGKPASKGIYCIECHIRRKRYYEPAYKPIDGCRFCGEPVETGFRVCEKHHQICADTMRRNRKNGNDKWAKDNDRVIFRKKVEK